MRTATRTYGTETIKQIDDKKTDYISAKKLADVLGGLPSNVLVDRIARSEQEKPLKGPFWTNQILIYPERDGMFVNADFVDWQTKWLLPAAYIPAEIMGVKGMGLLIEPHSIETERSRTIIHPLGDKVSIIQPFLQESGWGRADLGTGMPVDRPDSEKWMATGEARYVWRVGAPAIRPIARDFGTPMT